MKSTISLGEQAVERIARLWQVDDERRVNTDGGFDWWPGDHRVSVRAEPGDPSLHPDAWRLTVLTDFLRGVDLGEARVRRMLLALGAFSPTYAWIFTPPEVNEKYGIPSDGEVYFKSTVYLRPDTASWLPEFFGRLAIMQPIDAQRTASHTAELLKAAAHVGGPSGPALPQPHDDILNVAELVYAPAGREVSAWAESDEFKTIAETYGRQDVCFGTGDRGGLTLETPIGQSSALVQCLTNVAHPALGNGLITTVTLPFWRTQDEIAEEAMWLNFFEASGWTDVPQLASWHPRQIGETFASANGFFIPNALYAPGLATNAALWRLGLARWVKERLWSELEDLTMMEIMERRLGARQESE